MKVLLIHNQSAGPGACSEQALCIALEQAGHAFEYCSALDDDWESALDDSIALIAIAGGDGTVKDVALKVLGRDLPLAIVPLGTANNIAVALGISGSPRDIAAGWHRGRRRPFDIGIARGAWNEMRFLEAAGVGVFPQLMPFIGVLRNSESFANSDEAICHDLKLFKTLIADCSAKPWIVRLDGKDASGEFLLVEAMNTNIFGPRLQIAPHADPADGLFDVVFIGDEGRDALLDYVEERLDGRTPRTPTFPTHRAAHVEIEWDGSNVHFDSQLWAQGNSVLDAIEDTVQPAFTKIEFQLERHALEFLVPFGSAAA